MKYWVVGATWGSENDQTELFLRRGYWQLGWDDEDAPDQANRRDQIKVDDRIAIKRMLGQGAIEIEIRAIGVVIDIDGDDKTIYIKWILTNLKRRVLSKGCFKSIHGPFTADDNWTNEVFRL
jgi:hypothetical protein